MRLDSSTFPVVKIFFDAPSEGAPEDAFLTFERLLAREQPFLLLHEKAVDSIRFTCTGTQTSRHGLRSIMTFEWSLLSLSYRPYRSL